MKYQVVFAALLCVLVRGQQLPPDDGESGVDCSEFRDGPFPDRPATPEELADPCSPFFLCQKYTTLNASCTLDQCREDEDAYNCSDGTFNTGGGSCLCKFLPCDCCAEGDAAGCGCDECAGISQGDPKTYGDEPEPPGTETKTPAECCQNAQDTDGTNSWVWCANEMGCDNGFGEVYPFGTCGAKNVGDLADVDFEPQVYRHPEQTQPGIDVLPVNTDDVPEPSQCAFCGLDGCRPESEGFIIGPEIRQGCSFYDWFWGSVDVAGAKTDCSLIDTEEETKPSGGDFSKVMRPVLNGRMCCGAIEVRSLGRDDVEQQLSCCGLGTEKADDASDE